jgi:hypothetical protein
MHVHDDCLRPYIPFNLPLFLICCFRLCVKGELERWGGTDLKGGGKRGVDVCEYLEELVFVFSLSFILPVCCSKYP